MAAPTQSDKTVSEDVKGKYEQLRTRNGVAGGGGGSRVRERTGFLAQWTFRPARLKAEFNEQRCLETLYGVFLLS